MRLTSGRQDIVVGIIDGPIALSHPAFAGRRLRIIEGSQAGNCTDTQSIACIHGTFVAGILAAGRNSAAPAICPECTFLIRSIFADAGSGKSSELETSPEALADAIVATVNAGARILNLSLALSQPSSNGHRELEQSLDYAARQGVIVIAAAGNQGTLASSPLTRHPWVIPVVAVNFAGQPTGQTNLGASISRTGIAAPGDRITSLGPDKPSMVLSGTSAAVPFVTGTVALLWSLFPKVAAATLKAALKPAPAPRRMSVMPALLNAGNVYRALAASAAR
ncbi:MAG: S8 family serine peptidase [Candidatus Competibacteraceae bacterium]